MPDVVVNVLDATNLERNLFLTTQLIDMDLKVVIALNMFDETKKQGIELDYETLGAHDRIPIVPDRCGPKTKVSPKLFRTVIAVFEDNEPTVRHIPHQLRSGHREEHPDGSKILMEKCGYCRPLLYTLSGNKATERRSQHCQVDRTRG